MDLNLESYLYLRIQNKEASRIDNDSTVVKHSPLLNIFRFDYSESMERLTMLVLNFVKGPISKISKTTGLGFGLNYV